LKQSAAGAEVASELNVHKKISKRQKWQVKWQKRRLKRKEELQLGEKKRREDRNNGQSLKQTSVRKRKRMSESSATGDAGSQGKVRRLEELVKSDRDNRTIRTMTGNLEPVKRTSTSTPRAKRTTAPSPGAKRTTAPSPGTKKATAPSPGSAKMKKSQTRRKFSHQEEVNFSKMVEQYKAKLNQL